MKYLIALIVFSLPAYLIRFSILGIPTTLLEILIYLTFIIGLILFIRVKPESPKDKIWLPAGLLLLAAGISVWISPLKIAALGELKAFFIDPLLVLWLILVYAKTDDWQIFINSIGLSGLIVSGQAIWQFLSHNLTPDGRVIGLFGYSPNYMALFLAPITVLVLGYALDNWKKNLWLAISAWLAVIIYLVAIYLSGSRAGLLAVGAGFLMFIIFQFRKFLLKNWYRKVALIIFFSTIIFLGWWLFKPNFELSPEQGGRITSSNNIRWQIWETSIEMVKDRPIVGLGLGNFQSEFTNLTKDRVNFPEFISPWALTPHNLYLMFWLSTGLGGLIAFLWLVVIFFSFGLKNKSVSANILMAGMATILSQGLVDTPYFKNDLSLMFWLMIGFMLILRRTQKIT